MSTAEIDAILQGNSSRKRWLLLAVVVGLAVVAAVLVFIFTRSEEADVPVEPERVQAAVGQLTTQVELTGSAVSERSAELGFEVAGVVAAVLVAKGDSVGEGDALATLEGADAQRRVQTAQVQLQLAMLRLDSLLADPEESAVASANQAVVSARAQVTSAEQALESLSEPPTASDLASAQQAVASALRDISSAEQALEMLSEPPTASDLASAEQAVASALRDISSAEQALESLSEPPSEGDLRSAEQAVAGALLDMSSAEEALADLTAVPSEGEISEARSAATQADVQLADATRLQQELEEALVEAHDDFCERYSGLIPNDEVIRSICESNLPLSEEQGADLDDSFEDRSVTYEALGNSLIDANVVFVAAAADRDTALSTLTSAEEHVDELLQPTSEEDVFQAEQALKSASSSHAAAVARLDELRETASEDEIYQAERTLEAAKASHTAAVARLDELREAASEEDVYQAQQAIEAARASHAAAIARLEELQAAVDESDFEQAMANLETAQAALASAQAQYDELVAGPTENAIEQQRQDVRLAELTLEESLADLRELTVFASFDGIVEAVNVQPGDSVTSGSAAFTLSTSDRMLIELTVTEEELLSLEAGQTGVANFDAIDGFEYPVRVESIGRVPNTEQGVVTYNVEARILTGSGEVAPPRLAGGRPGGGGFGGGFGGVGAIPGIELPEGVTPEQVQEAIVRGEPLPDGVVIPPQVMQMIENLRASGGLARLAGGEQESAGQAGATGQGEQAAGGDGGGTGRRGAAAVGPLPAPGMSASVTILTEVRDESVLLPASAVRQLDGLWFVTVPAPAAGDAGPGFERVVVEIGESDGESVEIISGVADGTVVLIGADNSGVAFSATLQQPSSNPGFGPGQGGFGAPGGGGRR